MKGRSQNVGDLKGSNHVYVIILLIAPVIGWILIAISVYYLDCLTIYYYRDCWQTRIWYLIGPIRHGLCQRVLKPGNVNNIFTYIIQVIGKGVTKPNVRPQIKYFI
jgi:hypothetical protein